MTPPVNSNKTAPPSTVDIDKLPALGEELWGLLADRLLEIDSALLRADKLLHANQPWMKGKIGIGWRKLHEYEKRPYPVVWTYRREGDGIRWFPKDIEPTRLITRACSRGAFADGYDTVREVLALVQELFDERQKLNTIIKNHRIQIRKSVERQTRQAQINSRLASLEHRGTTVADQNIDDLMKAVEKAT
jgi:hypothetical protein